LSRKQRKELSEILRKIRPPEVGDKVRITSLSLYAHSTRKMLLSMSRGKKGTIAEVFKDQYLETYYLVRVRKHYVILREGDFEYA
jgi:Fe2+ transport system protein FeoA